MRVREAESGFTLIEVAIALVTVGILALGVMLAFTTSDVQDRDAYETTRNQNVCVSMMEQVEAMPFTDLMALSGNPLSLNFERWSFQIVVNKLDSDLASIEILAWVTAQQSGHVRLVTLKSRKQEAF